MSDFRSVARTGRLGRLAALAGILFIIVTSSGVTPGGAVPAAHACSCAMLSMAELVRGVDIVVEGRVARIDRPAVIGVSTQPITYTIEVDRVWRGPVDGKPLAVETAVSGASCGLDTIEQGQRVVMVASAMDGRLTTDLCNGSGPATPDRLQEVTVALGPGQVVVPQRAPTPGRELEPATRPGNTGFVWIAPVAVTGVGLAAMTVAVVIAATYRRRTTRD